MSQNTSKIEWNNAATGSKRFPVSDADLRHIAEQGFFLTPGSLAAARAACAELVFARAMIQAQTAKIESLAELA